MYRHKVELTPIGHDGEIKKFAAHDRDGGGGDEDLGLAGVAGDHNNNHREQCPHGHQQHEADRHPGGKGG